MQWARVFYDEKVNFGTVDGDHLWVHQGDMFGLAVPTGERILLRDSRWLTPCEPTKMLALWNNFHAPATKNGWEIPPEPLYFSKTANSFCAHQQNIAAPRSYDGRVVYEGELGIVIGRTAKDLSVEQARQAIFGYCCVNDVTALDLIGADASFAQWTRAKNFDQFGVFGPVIATDFDPMAASVRTLLNGRERQNYPLSDMIFSPAQLVSRLSCDMTLLPGDVIACGTSLGVLPMRPGSEVEIVIDRIGCLKNSYGEEG